MSSSIAVTPRTHWVNGWFLRMFAHPIVRLDGVDHEAKWGRPLRIDTAGGTHELAVGARYRGTTSVLGAAEARVDVPDGQHVGLVARNGLFNHQPFAVRTLGAVPHPAS